MKSESIIKSLYFLKRMFQDWKHYWKHRVPGFPKSAQNKLMANLVLSRKH